MTTFVVLVPVKHTQLGKSRLIPLSDGERQVLATAFALDTLAAVQDAATAGAAIVEVIVVTDDVGVASRAAALGASIEPDAGELNRSLAQAAQGAHERHPEAVLVALCADLPAATGAELTEALLDLDGSQPAIVVDVAGTGTTMYAASYDRFDPAFGVHSRTRHQQAGAVQIGGELPGLRCDVDDLTSLGRARSLGLGPHSRAALRERDGVG
ncbi:MAG: 2-phospho-L-lactate guanylyltransferase [Nocardioides sp.]